jgi:hypothetical protein
MGEEDLSLLCFFGDFCDEILIVCRIRLEHIRPAGLIGISSENAAHRIAEEDFLTVQGRREF